MVLEMKCNVAVNFSQLVYMKLLPNWNRDNSAVWEICISELWMDCHMRP